MSQRILFQSDFENIPLVLPDSLPSGWKKLDVDMNNPSRGWAIRDTNQVMGGDTVVNRPRSHSGKKCLHISWLAGAGGNKLNDDWVWTDSLRIQTGDSLIWWMLIGSTPLIVPYMDSVQLYVCSAQNPGSIIQKLSTIKSNDSAGFPLNNNTWTLHKYNLSTFAGQKIFIAWRYYIVVTEALWVNIDDLLIGNRSAIGIRPISSNIPSVYQLKQNYPNPFNPYTNIEFELPKADFVKISVYNSLGEQVQDIISEPIKPGKYRIIFSSGLLASGVYYYRMITGSGFDQTNKMILVK
jgi:hypothetical protein